MSAGDKADEAIELARAIGKLLEGKHPTVQGGALADLVSLWAAGHHPDLRDRVVDHWILTMRGLIAVNAKALEPLRAEVESALKNMRMPR